ncbi:MAG: tetratricopeptide repeat protein, partial [Gemmataceae bacterium]|nr:tetratricopeptide repeat protein [Gemmataceae bacterium]
KQAGDRRAEALARQVEDERRAAAERERAGRNAEAVATLLGACEAALRDDDPDRAEAALAEADRRLSEGGGDAHRDRLDRARADLTLVRELDRIEGEMWTSILQSAGSGVNTEATVDAVFARQRAALAAYGVVPGRAPAAEAGRRLTGSAVAGRALASLDMWLDQESSAEVRQYLRAVSAAADPDPYRDAVRDAVLARDGRRHGELARQPDALRQPHWFADMILAGLPREHEAWGRKVLESALARRPGDLGLLMTLGNYVTADLARAAIGKKEAETGRAAGVALRWHQAAVAAHPRNPFARFALGGSLLFAGDHDGAFPHIEAAARLDPTSILARQMLANLYIRRGDLDRAVDELRAVVRLAPNDAGHARALDQALDHALARQAGRLAPPPREAKPKPPGQ